MIDWEFLYSRRDRKGILAIVFLIATIGILYTMESKSMRKSSIDFTEFKQRAESFYQEEFELKKNLAISKQSTKSKSRRTNQNRPKSYKNSSKISYQSSSLAPSSEKIIKDHSAELEPKNNHSQKESETKHKYSGQNKNYRNNYRRYNQKLDVNTSDVIDWEALPGIGPYYSKIITDFREKLGGFTSIEQVGETWRLPDSTFLLVKPFLQMSAVYRQIDINLADEKTLSLHPYINWKEAKLIYNYRREHGPYISIEEVLNIKAIDEIWFNKLHPYLAVEPPTPIVQN